MTTLYLAWQDRISRRWFPVGRLDADDSVEPVAYAFSYVKGAQDAVERADFFALPGFPELTSRYRSQEMFPLFKNRLMNLRRPDRPAYLHQLGIDVANWNPVAELAASGIYSDVFEIFPPIIPDAEGRFENRFVLHGLRHTNQDSIRRTESLSISESLGVAFQLNNPIATHAIMLHTHDSYLIGWLPRYLIDGLHQDDAWKVTDVKATVAQVNLDAPLSHRLLIDFSGKLPAGFYPMEDLPQYQPIVPPPYPHYPTNKSSGKNADTV